MKLPAPGIYGGFAAIQRSRPKPLSQPAPTTPLPQYCAAPGLRVASAIPASAASRHAREPNPAASIPVIDANRPSLLARIRASHYNGRTIGHAGQPQRLPVGPRRLDQDPNLAVR